MPVSPTSVEMHPLRSCPHARADHRKNPFTVRLERKMSHYYFIEAVYQSNHAIDTDRILREPEGQEVPERFGQDDRDNEAMRKFVEIKENNDVACKIQSVESMTAEVEVYGLSYAVDSRDHAQRAKWALEQSGHF